jgi:hypothetical protein
MASTSSSNDKKRKCISLEINMILIEKLERKIQSKAEICREHDIASSTLHTILKDRNNIMSAFSSGSFQQKTKKIRKPDYEDVDCALHTWFQQDRSKNIQISGPILIEKGKELAESRPYYLQHKYGLVEPIQSTTWNCNESSLR